MSEVDRLARIIRHSLALSCVFFVLWAIFWNPRDATDPAGGRSGMALLTDAETGCQYLARGGITPRLDAEGHQMGCKPSS